MLKDYATYAHDNGGRVLLLFLLFLLAIYEFYTMGIAGMALICLLPVFIFGLYLTLRYKMAFFWILFVVNYIVMGLSRYVSFPVPVTAFTIIPQVMLVMVLIIDIQDRSNARYANMMLFGITLWAIYMVLQIFNKTCLLPISMAAWGQNFMFYVIALYLAYFIITTFIRTPEKISKFLRIWAYLTIAASFWAWRQKTFGWDNAENYWLNAGGATTHIIGGSIRYFSFFSDAANFGCSMGASAVAFFVLGITSKIKRERLLFIITGFCATYSFFMSGTRAGLLCFLVGVALYIIISKSFKIAIPVAILGGTFYFVLAFTQIGQSNMQIRRMRTAFSSNDASANVRDINKQALKKYMRDAPFGLGFNIDIKSIPSNHKYKIVTQIASDSTYVYLWEYTGIIGALWFAFANILILFGGCSITMFKLKTRRCQGIGGAFCCAFLAIQAGGYANNILLQYPNVLLYYGGMAIVYLLPRIEKKFGEYDDKRLAEQEEKRRLKQEKKLASRV